MHLKFLQPNSKLHMPILRRNKHDCISWRKHLFYSLQVLKLGAPWFLKLVVFVSTKKWKWNMHWDPQKEKSATTRRKKVKGWVEGEEGTQNFGRNPILNQCGVSMLLTPQSKLQSVESINMNLPLRNICQNKYAFVKSSPSDRPFFMTFHSLNFDFWSSVCYHLNRK